MGGFISASCGTGTTDTDGDGVIDNLDHSQDYQVLPVRVELQWTGPTGPRQVAFHSVFSEGGP